MATCNKTRKDGQPCRNKAVTGCSQCAEHLPRWLKPFLWLRRAWKNMREHPVIYIVVVLVSCALQPWKYLKHREETRRDERHVTDTQHIRDQIDCVSSQLTGLPAYHHAVEKWKGPLREEYPHGFAILGAEVDGSGNVTGFFAQTGNFLPETFEIDWQHVKIAKPSQASIAVWLPPYKSGPPVFVSYPKGLLFKMDHTLEGIWCSSDVTGYYIEARVVEIYGDLTTIAFGVKKGRPPRIKTDAQHDLRIVWQGGFIPSYDFEESQRLLDHKSRDTDSPGPARDPNQS